ncbi:MAG: inorganic phosphate transporter [Bifidobacterium breve]
MWIVPMLALVFTCSEEGTTGPSGGHQVKASRRVTAVPLLMLAAAVAVLPAANSRVGETIVAMVSSEGSGGQRPLLLATVLVAASATLLVLNGGGVPTSITLALVGASSGAGSAGGHPQWHLVLRVLGIAILSPLVAFAISRTIYLLFHSRTPQSSTIMVFLGFLLTCIAYGSNDGQKMVALFGTAMGVDLGAVTHSAAITAIVTAAFLIGVLTGMPKGAAALQRGTIVPDSRQIWVTLWAASVAVLVSSALGSPVSMTQSISGALIGTCQTNDWRKVRWGEARRILIAWAATLPMAWILGYAAANGLGLLPL